MLDCQSYFNTVKWSMMIGTNGGYELSQQQEMPESEFAELYRTIAEKVFQETGVYISAVMHRSRSLYRTEWGCPPGGEFSYTLTGCHNPLYSDINDYLHSLDLLTGKMKERLKQSAVYLEITPAHCDYYRNNES